MLGFSDILRANTIWPKKLIATAATKMLEKNTNIPAYSQGLSPEDFTNVVHNILCSDSQSFPGEGQNLVSVGPCGIRFGSSFLEEGSPCTSALSGSPLLCKGLFLSSSHAAGTLKQLI